MDYLELQRRANVLVDKVNEFEANLTGTEANENEVLDQHKYADTACLSPVLRTIFGADVATKTNRDLTLPTDLWFFSSNSPANITKFTPFVDTSQTPGYETTTKEFIQNIDMMNNYNMLQLDVKENTVVNKEDRIKQGINYSQSVHINDAILIESQVANLFKWNTTSEDDIDNNVIVNNRQVPGIVCYYLGNNYDSSYTATLPQNKTNKLNGLTYSYPTYYGAYYTKDEAASQVGQYPGSECLRMFIPGMFYTSGVLRSPQQIWLPDVRFGDDNIGYGYNWQAQGLYHELVFKNKRKTITKTDNLDFVPGLDSVSDNDEQGFATRLALAKQKKYYKNRPWFTELDSLSELDASKLADNIDEKSKNDEGAALTDTEFYTNYKLDYSTFADSYNIE